MKKLFLLFSILFVLSSCGKSDEEKLNDLIEEAIYENPPISVKEGYLIKSGYNKLRIINDRNKAKRLCK